jgi:hypothetical protein
MSQTEKTQMDETQRKEIFSALVASQDEGNSVEQSRKKVARQFGIAETAVVAIEREGLDQTWPPL